MYFESSFKLSKWLPYSLPWEEWHLSLISILIIINTEKKMIKSMFFFSILLLLFSLSLSSFDLWSRFEYYSIDILTSILTIHEIIFDIFQWKIYIAWEYVACLHFTFYAIIWFLLTSNLLYKLVYRRYYSKNSPAPKHSLKSDSSKAIKIGIDLVKQ